jgi:addiction module HigA family antidote
MIGPTPAVHPGEILRGEFLVPLEMKPYRLAKALLAPRTRIERLPRGEAAVTADTTLRPGRQFGTGPEFWMNLQTADDIATTAPSLSDLSEIHPRQTAA